MPSSNKLRAALLAGVAAVAFSGTDAFAQDDVSARLDRLEHMIDAQQAQIKSQQAEIGALKSQLHRKSVQLAGEAPPPAPPQPEITAAQFAALQNKVDTRIAASNAAPSNEAVVSLKNGKPLIASADGRYTFSPRLMVQGDWAAYSKDKVAGIPIRSSGDNFRRAWIGFQGKFAGDFGYKFIYDFGGSGGDETYQAYINNKLALASTGAGTGAHIQSAVITYKGILDPFTFQIGAAAPPSNLGDTTASDDLIFNERASPSQLARSLAGDDGREGIGLFGHGRWWFASAFLTGDTVGKAPLIAPANGQGAFVGRVAFFPWNDPATNFSVHLGGNYTDVFQPQQTTNDLGVTTTPIALSDRPELRVDNFTLLNTGAIDATSVRVAGLEGAVSWGPLLLQGENFWYGIDRKTPAAGVSDPAFDGWYLDASWVLTGEYHRYNPATASYTRPSPARGFDPAAGDWGAWEIAGRYSDSDLDYHLHSPVAGDPVIGGHQKIWTGALNFYPNDILKFGLEWENVTADNVAALGNDAKFDVVSVRSQVSF
ncbi:MAG TPA: porin [Rhizomicrobium sp.]|jgi:phosphate-selective porin OprO/OprP